MTNSRSVAKYGSATGGEETRCLLIPLAGRSLLVPNSLIAEVVRNFEILPLKGKASWILGLLSWRGTALPVISFERLTGADATATFSNIAVFNTLSSNPELPFFAVATQGIPRSLNVTASSVSAKDVESRTGVLQEVLVDGEEALIPDIDGIEKWLLERKGIELAELSHA